jgi:hypothetical protein
MNLWDEGTEHYSHKELKTVIVYVAHTLQIEGVLSVQL